MKRTAFLWALLLAAVFILPADAATYEAEGLFRLRYDEAAYTLDDQTYAYESETGASRWFFVLYNDEMTFDMSLLRMENDAGVTLSTAAEERRQSYLNELLDWYQDEDASFLETVEAGDGQTPFWVLGLRNEFGPYLMAETVIDGNAIDLLPTTTIRRWRRTSGFRKPCGSCWQALSRTGKRRYWKNSRKAAYLSFGCEKAGGDAAFGKDRPEKLPTYPSRIFQILFMPRSRLCQKWVLE